MLVSVISLSLLCQVQRVIGKKHACIPSTHFVLNGRICFCDNQGKWNDSACRLPTRRTCLPGDVIWQGCSKCVCQNNGQLLCNNDQCFSEATYKSDLVISSSKSYEDKDFTSTWCTPFKSYYINCSICVCPASGLISEAHCAVDNSCQNLTPSASDFLVSLNNKICIPRVMYLFPCLHCMCSDDGTFILDKCIETCHKHESTESTRRCISRTFYRKNCNVCWCPENSVPSDKLCTKSVCDKTSKFRTLESMMSVSTKCIPHRFLDPKCVYCTCNMNGKINEHSCLELDCLKTKDFQYDNNKDSCSPGEMVPHCVECLCPGYGVTNKTYCSKGCSYQSKINVMENILKDSKVDDKLIQYDIIKKYSENQKCMPNFMYLDQGKYCLCPDNESTAFKLCTSFGENVTEIPSVLDANIKNTDITKKCKPNTFVEIDCNTCYCSKNGEIDPKWCTYDDCEAKKIIQLAQKSSAIIKKNKIESNETCTVGSVTKIDCNFCICPQNGFLKDRVCTKNSCSEVEGVNDVKFICEPLAYYLVDCNVCLCPRDGVKNVEKCTKKICEKSLLRSDSCDSGEFFSRDCNVCVCPPNGVKSDSVCTNYVCSEWDAPWKKIFRISQKLLSHHTTQSQNAKRSVDVCFSGEEFEVDCKICVCPDVGLKAFASCTDLKCQEKNTANNTLHNIQIINIEENKGSGISSRSKRETTCFKFNMTSSIGRKECTPGSLYIIRCQQCICPYMGHINHFCRPLPPGKYCEKAFPYVNYLSMGRRTDDKNTESTYSTLQANETASSFDIIIDHQHTKYSCTQPGNIQDDCFICECEENKNVVIEEHCFKSNSTKCDGVKTPSFFDKINMKVVE